MTYDLMVFDPDAAPSDHDDFMAWFQQQAEWSEPHGYDDPAVSSEGLHAWFMEMQKSFPAMNGPHSSPDADPDDARVTDYCVGQSVIYVCFSWSVADEAKEEVFRLAGKHRVGFFNVSSDKADVWLPNAPGELMRAHCG